MRRGFVLEIRERLRPFSHQAGISCYIPGTKIAVSAYPTRIVVGDQVTDLEVTGPLKEFTLMQDLERNCVVVFSEKYRFYIGPEGTVSEKRPVVQKGEQLFLGCTKKQEWEQMRRRFDMRELFPLWCALGSKVEAQGSFSLLDECRDAVAAHRPEKIVPAFKKLFLVGFEGLMVPRQKDGDFQGITAAEVQGDPAIILSEGAQLIRSCFLDQERILPNLPPEFASGKFCSETIDIEWTKKEVRRVFVRSKEKPQLHFPRAIKEYRVTKKGEMLYVLDRFQK